MIYSAAIIAVSERPCQASKLVDDIVPIHIEVLLPAFMLGRMLARPAGSDPHLDDLRKGHQEGPEDEIEHIHNPKGVRQGYPPPVVHDLLSQGPNYWRHVDGFQLTSFDEAARRTLEQEARQMPRATQRYEAMLRFFTPKHPPSPPSNERE